MELERLVGEGRERELKPMPARERRVAIAFAVSFLAAAAAVAALVPLNRSADPVLLAALLVFGAVARRVRFEIGAHIAFPDQLIFIPMLILAPLPIVPLLAMASYALAAAPDLLRGRVHPDRWLYTVGDAWQSVGAVVVIAALAPGQLDSHKRWVYVLALVAECAVTVVIGVLND